MRKSVLALTALALVGGFAARAEAEDWVVTVGSRLRVTPAYEGAHGVILVPVPVLGLRRADEADRYTAPDDGLKLPLWRTSVFTFGPVVRAAGKRDALGDRVGLREVDLAIEPGGYVDVRPAEWLRAHLEMRKGVHGHRGWVGDAGLDFIRTSGPWVLATGPRLGWGSRDYMDAYFGVTAAEAAASPAVDTAFSPGSGLRYYGGEATVARRLDEHWKVAAFGGFHQLVGDAKAGPIVQTVGESLSYFGGVGFTYSYTVHR
jgi:outer membrane scaffolding protein for murein synthesis (MipA/OmpV family)